MDDPRNEGLLRPWLTELLAGHLLPQSGAWDNEAQMVAHGFFLGNNCNHFFRSIIVPYYWRIIPEEGTDRFSLIDEASRKMAVISCAVTGGHVMWTNLFWEPVAYNILDEVRKLLEEVNEE